MESRVLLGPEVSWIFGGAQAQNLHEMQSACAAQKYFDRIHIAWLSLHLPGLSKEWIYLIRRSVLWCASLSMATATGVSEQSSAERRCKSMLLQRTLKPG